ncbi:MAG: flagellum-specific ATP synthase FliI, partial [Alphaproteobacteria bacterium]|nr:flagellum-specific ATP synthase FliI [Alphaproteobacteria bacterium]
MSVAQNIITDLNRVSPVKIYGRVKAVKGMLIELGGIQGSLTIGDHCDIIAKNGRRLTCEVIG